MPPKTERRHQQGETSKLRIIEATFEIASEYGYEGTSMAKVCERAGLPASSVYWHFKNKDELFAEVIEHSFHEWVRKVPRWEIPAPGTSVDEAVTSILGTALASFADQADFWRLGVFLLLERKVADPSARSKFVAIRESVIATMSSWWRAVLPPSAVVAQPRLPDQIAQLTIAAADGLLVAAQTEVDWDFAELAHLLAVALQQLTHTLVAAHAG